MRKTKCEGVAPAIACLSFVSHEASVNFVRHVHDWVSGCCAASSLSAHLLFTPLVQGKIAFEYKGKIVESGTLHAPVMAVGGHWPKLAAQ